MDNNSPYCITDETIDSLSVLWRDPAMRLYWNPVFVLPPWLKAWGRAFGADRQAAFLAVRSNNALIGIAPYAITGETVHFWGSGDVCDYLDVVVLAGKERQFFETLLIYLGQRELKRLSFESLRSDSVTMTHLPEVVTSLGGKVSKEKEDVSLGLDLPRTWDEYLSQLSGKERHEVRRKVRRLHEAGRVRFRSVSSSDLNEHDCQLFLQIFAANRSDKAEFMTDTMACFFRDLTVAMAKENLLHLFFLELNDIPVATSLCFDYGSTRYLYNSGYDKRFQYLSVGLLCKVMSIKDGIEQGLKQYDFLKGAEPYKARLGGKPIQIYRCRAEML